MWTKRLFIHLVIYAAGFTALAAFLPWYIFAPLGAALAFAHVTADTHFKRRRYESIQDGIRNIQGDKSPEEIAPASRGDVDELMFKGFKEIMAELERKNFQLVEKNIQLLSIKEIGATLVSSLDESRVVDSVINFLSKGLGFRELFVGIYRSDESAFNLYTFRDRPGSQTHDRAKVPLQSMDGMLQKAVFTRKSLLIRDADMHKLGNVGGEPLFGDSTLNSFVVVPMVRSDATQDCGDKETCILKADADYTGGPIDSEAYRCPACERIPTLGFIGVTDGFKAASLSKVDLVSVETLAVQIGTMLENARLFSELKYEESFRDKVINSMMNGLLSVGVDGEVMLGNETAAQLTGYDPNELRRMNVTDLVADNQKKGGENPIMRSLRTGRRSFQEEAWLIKKDGSKDPIILNTSFLVNDTKQIQGALAVFVDITQVKRMEEQIMHLDKLAALGRFSSSIAHEIRNPLTGIAAGIQYLKRAGQVAESQVENIDFILEEVNRIDRLIGDLMSVVRIGDLIYEETRLETVVKNSVVSMSEVAKQKSVTITTSFPEETRSLSVDADRINQVIINLLKNAIEASHYGGVVSIDVSFPQDVTDVLFDAVQDFAIIEVKDTGLGLTEDEKKRVFEPFYSKKSGGTGLGLYVTHSIIERHGGYIYVDSEYGVGTTFTVYLPVEQVQHGDSSEIGHPVSG